jgi:hypothetical protein
VASTVPEYTLVWQVAVEVPANPYVTKLESSCDAATHVSQNLALCLWRVKAGCPRRHVACEGLYREEKDKFSKLAQLHRLPRTRQNSPATGLEWNRNLD